jgi:hypothetical protein
MVTVKIHVNDIVVMVDGCMEPEDDGWTISLIQLYRWAYHFNPCKNHCGHSTLWVFCLLFYKAWSLAAEYMSKLGICMKSHTFELHVLQRFMPCNETRCKIIGLAHCAKICDMFHKPLTQSIANI